MKYSKSKRFNIPKFLFIFVGLCSCVCALYIQETLSYFYTSYGFANTFQTPRPDSISVYQKFTNPTPLSSDSNIRWVGQNCTKELFIENTSNEGGDSRYIRLAYSQVLQESSTSGTSSEVSYTSSITDYFGPVFNATDGIYNGYHGSPKDKVNDGWAQHGEWYYYKTPLAPGKKLQVTDSLGNRNTSYSESTSYDIYTLTFIVETLPSTVSDEDLKNTWGVSKTELGLS